MLLLLSAFLIAPTLEAKQAFSAELERIAEAGGAACEEQMQAGVATGHVCRWQDGTLLARADYTSGYRHFLYYLDGSVQTECVLAEGRFDCAEWDEDGRRLSPFEAVHRARERNAEITRTELERTSRARIAFTELSRRIWESHAADPHRIRATILLDCARRRRIARATELASMGFVGIEIIAILRDEENGSRRVDARPMSEREPYASR